MWKGFYWNGFLHRSTCTCRERSVASPILNWSESSLKDNLNLAVSWVQMIHNLVLYLLSVIKGKSTANSYTVSLVINNYYKNYTGIVKLEYIMHPSQEMAKTNTLHVSLICFRHWRFSLWSKIAATQSLKHCKTFASTLQDINQKIQKQWLYSCVLLLSLSS